MNDNTEELLHKLRRKEGTWVEWGQWIEKLKKLGTNSQTIFEATGFEPIQQNQVIVGSQVYTTIINAGVSESTRLHFERKGSDILYELRILTQKDRAATAEFILERNIDVDGAKDIAKAVKDFSYFSKIPDGFTNHPGDAIAYQYWRFAKQKHDLAEKSRLIAKGLIFAESQSAKKEIEKLLLQFADTELSAPVLPFYRSESAENLPKIIPVVGNFPITKSDLSAIPNIEPEGLFQIVKCPSDQAVVSLPGWAVIFKADDPVAIIAHTDHLPVSKNQPDEPVLIIVDREARTWNINGYFLYDAGENLQVKWFPEDPNIILFGQVILILRPKRVLDEELNTDGWQIDE